MRSRPSGQQGRGLGLSRKVVGHFSGAVGPGHMTLGFSVPWGRRGYHQATNSDSSDSPNIM
ncbi:mCG147180 [Mus musculus]|nr:mCG147180 [Mus musculus]